MKKLIALAFACGVISAHAADYYWTGAAEDAKLATPGNWTDADGNEMSVAPATSDTLIFDGISSPITIVHPGVAYYGYVVTNAAATVTLQIADSKNVTLGAGGVTLRGTSGGLSFIGGNGGGTLTFPEGRTVLDVAKNLTFSQERHTQGKGTSTVLVKCGAGTANLSTKSGYRVYGNLGTYEIHEGTLVPRRTNMSSASSNINWRVVGPAAKTVIINSSSDSPVPGLHAENDGGLTGLYIEDSDAEGTLTIDLKNNVFQVNGYQPDTRMTAGWTSASYTKFVWDPVSSERTLTYAKATINAANLAWVVKNGTLRLAEGLTLTSLAELSLSAGTTLKIASDVGDISNVPVKLADATAKVKAESGLYSFKLKSITVGDVAVPDGIYAAKDLAWYEGDAILVVGTPSEPDRTDAAWVGGGADTSILNKDNWGGTLPDLTSGSLVATFPAAATVTVPAGEIVKVKGIVVADGTSSDTFALEGAGSVWLGSEGLKTATEAGAGKVSVACGIVLVQDQTWAFGKSNAITFTEDASLASLGGVTWFGSGASSGTGGCGSMTFKSSNPNLGDCEFVNAVVVTADCALGKKNVTMNGTRRPSVLLTMKNCTLDNVKLTLTGVNNSSSQQSLNVAEGTCRFTGEVVFDMSSANWYTVADSATVYFEGGFSSALSKKASRNDHSKSGSGSLYVENVPLKTGRSTFGYTYKTTTYGGNFFLNVADNEFRRGLFLTTAKVHLHTGAPNAFKLGTSGVSFAALCFTGTADWNLHGNDQQLEILGGEGAGTIKSETAATVRLLDEREYDLQLSDDAATGLNNGQQHTNKCVFAGGVSLSKEGALDYTLFAASTSTGGVSVAKGHLTFAAGASWKNASAVKVSGTGVLTVPDGKVFGKGAAMTIDTAEGASVEIPVGQVLRVASLTVDGTPVKGVYKGAGVTGGGEIFAGKPGLVLFFR